MVRVAFRVDGTALMGGGHVMRSLALADELRARGAETVFVSAVMAEHLRARVERSGHLLQLISGGSKFDPPVQTDWELTLLSTGAQEEDARRTIQALGGQADWIVVDHYLLDRQWQEALRSGTRRIMVIDDLANRPHDCDLLLDQTLGRAAADYSSFVPSRAKLLLGPRYALLRPEFARERLASLARRRCAGAVRNILISLGMTDIEGVTAEVAHSVLSAAPSCKFEIVLGSQSPDLNKLSALARKQPAVRLHVDTRHMALLMRDADLAIGASGATSWERCCLGLPTISLVIAENQSLVARSLAEAGASVTCNSLCDLPCHVRSLLHDSDARLTMVAAAAAITGGEGVPLVSAAMLGDSERSESDHQPIRIRRATEADSEPLWLWRNDPTTRQASQNSHPVPWPDHALWIKRLLARPDRHLFIAERSGTPIGMVRFDRLVGDDLAYEVSINVRPEARGEGTGKAILAAGCAEFLQQAGSVRLKATLHEANLASRRIFEALGFLYESPLGEDGFHRYVRPQNAPVFRLQE